MTSFSFKSTALRNLCLVSCFLLTLSACDLDPCGSTPDAFIAKADDFFEQAKQAELPVSSEDWARYDERLAQLVDDCYPQHEDQLSKQQDRHFWAEVSTYYIERYGKAGAKELLREARKGINNTLQKAEKWLDENL